MKENITRWASLAAKLSGQHTAALMLIIEKLNKF
jgi:hypothetical protein